MDGDLNRLKGSQDRESFVAVLDEMMASELTNDFWTTHAAGGARKLVGAQPGAVRVRRRAEPARRARAVLAQEGDRPARPRDQDEEEVAGTPPPVPARVAGAQGVTASRLCNQIANFALLEWPEHGTCDAPPSEYVPKHPAPLRPTSGSGCTNWHDTAWPIGVSRLFGLSGARRRLMAGIIRHKAKASSGHAWLPNPSSKRLSWPGSASACWRVGNGAEIAPGIAATEASGDSAP